MKHNRFTRRGSIQFNIDFVVMGFDGTFHSTYERRSLGKVPVKQRNKS